LGYVLVALVLTVVTVWGLIQYGVPALAKHVAHALPSSVDAALGQESLEIMDQTLFSPSQLSEQRQRELRTAFAKMTQNVLDGHDWQFELRSSKPVGPNAFALPSGIVVLTDELVLLAKEDQEIVAVLAHEMGHVVHRHALRRLLQDSVVVLLIAAVTGDVTAITSLAATIPVVLVEAKYSRDFEREADHFALQYLRQHDIAPKHFAAILLRMEKESPDGDAMHDYLSTHPATRERVKIFQEEG
ncbi:MAG: M48 family metallopeptidase, partial [Acidiferrobacterales bacterium]